MCLHSVDKVHTKPIPCRTGWKIFLKDSYWGSDQPVYRPPYYGTTGWKFVPGKVSEKAFEMSVPYFFNPIDPGGNRHYMSGFHYFPTREEARKFYNHQKKIRRPDFAEKRVCIRKIIAYNTHTEGRQRLDFGYPDGRRFGTVRSFVCRRLKIVKGR